jgi:hypothetical protein
VLSCCCRSRGFISLMKCTACGVVNTTSLCFPPVVSSVLLPVASLWYFRVSLLSPYHSFVLLCIPCRLSAPKIRSTTTIRLPLLLPPCGTCVASLLSCSGFLWSLLGTAGVGFSLTSSFALLCIPRRYPGSQLQIYFPSRDASYVLYSFPQCLLVP